MSTIEPDPRPRDDDLSITEHKLLGAAIAGTLVDLRVGDAALDDPAQGANWDAGRQVRAELLIELLTGTRRLDGKLPRAIKLRGARITGSLNLEAAIVTCPLLLQDCHIGEPVNLNDATAKTIRMPGCCLTSLTAEQLHTTGDLTLNAKFSATGEITLIGAKIGGHLNMNGAVLTNPNPNPDPGGRALDAAQLKVGLNMFCEGLKATGEVILIGAHICGQLVMNNAILTNPGYTALAADGVIVDQDMFCRDRFSATGSVDLPGAHIGGQLNMNGATLSNPGDPALRADRLTVGKSMFCGVKTTGEVILHNAHICGPLNMDGARIHGQTNMDGSTLTSARDPNGWALAADGLVVDGNMSCKYGFTATGEVRLAGAHISGQLDMTGATLASPMDEALTLDGADVSVLILMPKQRPAGVVDLTNCKVGTFYDDRATWPAVLRLRGFAYDSFGNQRIRRISTRRRLRWLTLNEGGYAPQLYDQLATMYQRSGDEQAVRKVAVAKQFRRRRYSLLSWLWYLTVGYGYRSWLAGAWVIALAALGTVVFRHAYPGHMVANSLHAPTFYPAVYALDLLLPVIELGQKSSWQPQGLEYQYWAWALTCSGWVLTTALVAGLTGILKRD
jgi:hypothetical protein